MVYQLNLEKEEAHVLIAAAVKAMRGQDPIKANLAVENTLIAKLISLGAKVGA